MSAFIVNEESIHKIVSYLDHSDNKTWLQRLPIELHNRMPGDKSDMDWMNRLGQAMQDLNRQAVDHRYNEKNDVFPYRHKYIQSTRMQVFKSIQCWLYQCSEGDCPANPLFVAMEGIMHSMAVTIVSRTAEYHNCKWD